jgi:hypothetical protein
MDKKIFLILDMHLVISKGLPRIEFLNGKGKGVFGSCFFLA